MIGGLGTIIASVLGAVGSGISSFFGFKGRQADTLNTAINTIAEMAKSDSNAAMAAALVIASENGSGSWIATNWRPITALIFVGMIVAKWFGHVPPGISPEEITHVDALMEIMVGGYVGGRTLEKVVNSFNVGKVLKTFVEKKLM